MQQCWRGKMLTVRRSCDMSHKHLNYKQALAPIKDKTSDKLNERPRKTLGFKTPNKIFHLRSNQ